MTWTDEQLAAIARVRGALLLDAPAGTGKTSVLVQRVVAAIADGVPADRVLCLTFTNRACREIRQRLHKAGTPRGVKAFTFHGLCAAILRAEATRVGLSPDFQVCDEDDAKEYLRRTLAALLPNESEKFIADLRHNLTERVERLKCEHIPPYTAAQSDEALAPELPAGVAGSRVIDNYHKAMARDHRVDFADLIALVRWLFRSGDTLNKWRGQFDWIQLDEYQDTSWDQFDLLRQLAEPHGNLAMLGDVDQTIYEWRRSEPRRIRGEFLTAFGPVELRLTRNQRAAPRLVAAGRAVIGACPDAVTTGDTDDPGPGEGIAVHRAADETAEAAWIGDRIRELLDGGFAGRIAVLARNNYRSVPVSHALTVRSVPHLTAESDRFFRRPAVKGAAACLRGALDPLDNFSLRRVLELPGWGIGRDELNEAIGRLGKFGMQVKDLLPGPDGGDPLGPLIAAVDAGRCVVFDVETTGLDADADRILEIAAVRVGPDGVGEKFVRLLNWDIDPGEFAAKTGLTRELLAAEGIDPATAIRDFVEFLGDGVPVGHNLRFDLGMVRAHAARFGIDFPADRPWFDTWDLSRRFSAGLLRHSLEQVAVHVKVRAEVFHRADADADTTAGILLHYLPQVRQYAASRARAVDRLGGGFARAATAVRRWRSLLPTVRPDQLLAAVALDAGLCEKADDGRTLFELVDVFRRHDDAGRRPESVLPELLQLITLNNDGDRDDPAAPRVFVGTVHQSKGMEFDAVFISGASDGEFPSWRSFGGDQMGEEHRLFYVAMTRAKTRLFVSHPAMSDRGPLNPSRFIAYIPEELREHSGVEDQRVG